MPPARVPFSAFAVRAQNPTDILTIIYATDGVRRSRGSQSGRRSFTAHSRASAIRSNVRSDGARLPRSTSDIPPRAIPAKSARRLLDQPLRSIRCLIRRAMWRRNVSICTSRTVLTRERRTVHNYEHMAAPGNGGDSCTPKSHRAISIGPRNEWLAATAPLPHTGERTVVAGLEYASCIRCLVFIGDVAGHTTITRRVACARCGRSVDGERYCSESCERADREERFESAAVRGLPERGHNTSSTEH